MSSKLVTVNAVVAMSNVNNGIGLNGTLPWRIPNDLKFFAQVTKFTKDKSKQNAVIVGRKTWFSLPNAFRPLPNRVNIVVSNTISDKKDLMANAKANLENLHICNSFEEAVKLAREGLVNKIESVYVIGGSQLYKSAFEYQDFHRLYLTRVFLDVKCDTFLEPANFLESFEKVNEFDESNNDENLKGFEVNTIQRESDIEYCFEVYEKKRTL